MCVLAAGRGDDTSSADEADGLYDASTALEEVFLLSSLQAGSRASTTRQLDEEGLDLKDGLTIQLSRVQM